MEKFYQNIFFKIILLFFYFSINFNQYLTSSIENCDNVKNLFINEGLINEKIKNSGSNLKICKSDNSCCNEHIENLLNLKSKTEFNQKFKQLINTSIADILDEWSKKFNRHFINTITSSQDEFDILFKKLYGPRYENNIDVFNNLFKNLELYQQNGNSDLDVFINDFFENLFIRLLEILNPNFQFNDSFFKCVKNNFKSLEPFGEKPQNLIEDLKRTLGASRTFVQSLSAGSMTIRQLNKIDIAQTCYTDLMQINYCSLCSGYLNLKPCKLNCESSYANCMNNYLDFEVEWNNYLNTIIQFGKRLETTLNLDKILGSLNYRISDVIMLFQENKISISEKIISQCETTTHKTKRSFNYDFFDSNNQTLTTSNKDTRSVSSDLVKAWKGLANEIKKKIKSFKSYWTKLPKAICKNSNPVTKCWNGTNSIDVNRQKKTIETKIKKKTNKFQLQIDSYKNKLQLITSKMISSYNGNGLEKFDFQTQETKTVGITIDPNEFFDNSDEEDEDYDQDNKKKSNDDNEDQTDDQNLEESINENLNDKSMPILLNNLDSSEKISKIKKELIDEFVSRSDITKDLLSKSDFKEDLRKTTSIENETNESKNILEQDNLIKIKIDKKDSTSSKNNDDNNLSSFYSSNQIQSRSFGKLSDNSFHSNGTKIISMNYLAYIFLYFLIFFISSSFIKF